MVLSQSLSEIENLIELDKLHYLHPTTVPKLFIENGPKIIFHEGKGIRVTDIKGETYIDGASMLWNVNLGHGNREIAEAAYDQMSTLAYSSSFYGYSNEKAVRLAEKVVSVAPGNLTAIFFTSGGSESNDTAFKLARFYWNLKNRPTKKKIVSISRSYHGATVSAGTATGIDAFHSFAGSKDPDMVRAKSHLTNCELGDTSDPNYEGCIRDVIEKEGAETIAAIILEPIQGAGGVHVSPDGYLQAVKSLCEENDILMISDEVICGFGRTGKMFGVDNWDVAPDIMCVAKGITSGYAQLGGVLINKEIRDTIIQYDQILGHGFTYSGHPTACAVGLKTLEILERDHILENVNNMEIELKKGFEYLTDKHRYFTKSRAKGLLAGFELQQDRDADIPFSETVRPASFVVDQCFKRKLILRAADFEKGKDIVAIAPPLIINKEEVQEMINIIDDALTSFEKTIS
ncbi:aspartate aminotransferase family protein [Bacillus haynesii]|uniref:aminotransferase family protein n=1 Tax=Bacillus haynesii TaxID=1925021 RepID=UPI002280A1BF|nr:aspartate aminotransferase family protein [Bacillus haynesii]MCY7753299.1 aspartate aminotransferase family protein [Bacillus haynesii]MCY8009477.1 aspartate aminotransferase family protein [Bacillus haynesii]MCY9274826.1 aspartate aminotransferase family protein [Bacillus haynesii]MCY9402217.1 aspartate aminotransferase family protein [Bacillus haynesii]MEC0707542.1 aspartate aminotransferase family protein [Bacillus haynesii]